MTDRVPKLRRLGIWVAAIGLVLFIIPAAAVLLLQFDGPATRFANWAAGRFGPWSDASIHVARAHIDGLSRYELYGVRLVSHDGDERAALDSVRLRLRPFLLLRQRLDVASVHVAGLRLRLTQRPDSTWDIVAPFAQDTVAQSTDADGAGWRVRVGDFQLSRASIEAHMMSAQSNGIADSLFVDGLTVRFADFSAGDTFRIRLDTLGAQVRAPARTTGAADVAARLEIADGRLRVDTVSVVSDSSDVAATGTLLLPGGDATDVRDIDFVVLAQPLDYRDVGAFVPGFDAPGSLRLDASVRGSSGLLEVRADGRTFDGGSIQLDGQFTPATTGPVSYDFSAEVRDIDATFWRAGATPVDDIEATVAVALRGPAIDSLDGTAEIRVQGGQLSNGTLESASLDAVFTAGEASFDAAARVVPWLAFASSGTIRPLDSLPDYELRLTLDQIDSLGTGPKVSNFTLAAALNGSGFSPTNAAGSATVDVAGQVGATSVQGGSIEVAWADGSASGRFDLPFGPGTIGGDLRAEWRDTLRSALSNVRVDQLDVAALLGDSTAGGTVSLTGNIALVGTDPSTLSADARALLERARWREIALDTGSVTLSLANGLARADATASGPAGRVAAVAHGQPFVADPTWVIDQLTVTGLDLAQTREGLPVSALNLALQGEYRGTGASGVSTATLTVDSSTLGRTVIGGGTFQLALDSGSLAVDGGARILDGDLRLVATALPFDSVPSVHVASARFDALSLASLSQRLDSVWLSGDLSLDARFFATAPIPALVASLDLTGSRLNGASLERGRATVQVDDDGVTTANLALAAAQGTADLEARARIGRAEDDAFDLSDALLTGAVDMPELQRLLGGDSVSASLLTRFSVAGGGLDPDDMAWTVSADATGRYGSARLDTLRLAGAIAQGVLSLDTMRVVSNVVHGGGRGSVALRRSSGDRVVDPTLDAGRLHIELSADSIGALRDFVAVDPLTLRAGELVIDAANSADGLAVTGGLVLTGLIAGPFASDSTSVDAGALFTDGAFHDATASIASVRTGWRTMLLSALEGSAVWDSSGVDFAADLRPDEASALTIAGYAEPRARTVRLESVTADLGAVPWALAGPARVDWGDRIAITDFDLVAGTSRIAVTGYLDRTTTQDLTVRLESVPLTGIATLAGLTDVTGSATGQLTLTGPAEQVELAGTLDLDIAQTSVDVSVQSVADALQIDAALADADARELRVQGLVPFRLSLVENDVRPSDAELAITVAADSFAVGWLTPFVRPAGLDRLQGRIVANARFEGTVDDPSISGSARLVGGRVIVPEQGVDYRNLEVSASFEGDVMRVLTARAEADGNATIEGSVVFETLTDPRLDLSARFDRFRAAHNQWASVGLSGTASASGSIAEPHLAGELQLVGTDIFADAADGASAARQVELTEQDFEMLESYFGYRAAEGVTQERDPLESWGMDLSVVLGTDVWLRKRKRPEMLVQLAGSLEVRKEPGDSIQLFGTLEAVSRRSYFEQFGKRFQVTTGTVTFNGAPTSWVADIEARYTVPSLQDPSQSEVAITMSVEGGMQDLNLTLGSEPTMETSDILSYLATGRPAASAAEFASAGGDSGVAGAGASVAFGAVSNILEDAAAESVGLDIVEIRQQGDQGAILVAGRYVSPRLFVGFQQPLALRRDDKGVGADETTTQIELEYAAYRWLLLNLQGGQSDFRFFFRTKYAF